MSIANITKNCMGTVSFNGKFPGMRKAQDFIVYPMKEYFEFATVQSDTRFGRIHLTSGAVVMSKAHPNGAYGHHLAEAVQIDTLSAEDLFTLKASIFSTASGMAGSRNVYCDNSAALEVFNTIGA